MPAQKGGDGLGQLVLGVAGDGSGIAGDEQHQAQQVALRQDGGRHGGQQAVDALRHLEGLALTGVLVDFPTLHDLLQLRGDPLAHKLPLAAARHGDDRVPVRDGADAAGGPAHGLAELRGEVLHTAQQRVFLEDDLTLAAGVDFQWIALPDPHGAPDLLGDYHPAQVVLMCQVKHKIFGALHRCFLLDFCATFMRVPRLPLAHSKYGNPSHTPQRHRRYHRGR